MTYNAYTTLNEIRELDPYKNSWNKLLKHLGKKKADDEPLHLLTILETNGFNEALRCLRVKSLERLQRHFQAWCAEQVLHHFEAKYPNDTRIREQIAMLRNDDATPEERDAARAAAFDVDSSEATLAAVWEVPALAARAAVWAAAKAAGGVEREGAYAATRRASRVAQEAQLRAMIGTP